MTDSTHGTKHEGPAFDSEIDVRRILEIGAWLAAITVVAFVVGYFFYRGLGKWSDRSDPAASPLPEASLPVEPPSPHLQATPEVELQAMLKDNAARLGSWGWVDRAAGVAHMPIDVAIEHLAQPEPAVTPAEAIPAAAAEAAATSEPAAAPAEGHAPAAHAGSGH